MKKVLLLTFAFLGLTLSTMASNKKDDNEGAKKRTTIVNGIETVTIQETFTAETLDGKVTAANNMLEKAFGVKAKVCHQETTCSFDYSTDNGDSARLMVNKLNNTLLLITKKSIK